MRSHSDPFSGETNYATSSPNEPLLEPSVIAEENNDELSSRKRKWSQDS